MSQRITDKLVKSLTPPPSGNRIYLDDDVSGFAVRITAAGAKAFVFNYRHGARQRRLTIGGYPAWTVAAAREEAKALRKRVDRGDDPMGAKHAERAAPTVASLCDRYETDHLPRKRPSSQRGDRAMLRLYVRPRLGALKVADVSYSDIEGLHRALRAKPYQANRLLALLSKMFALAIRWQMRSDNPCRGVERFPESKREVHLTGDQRAALLIAMQEHTQAGRIEAQTVQAFRLAMLTGARIGEVLSARWGQIDLEAGRWTKPGATTKQGTTHHAVLNAPARQLVAEILAQRGQGEYLFPSPTDPERPQAEYKHSWAAIRRLAGRDLADFRVHDLRHAFASEGAAAGLSLPMIGALLGHTNPSTTARYAHLLDDPLKAAAEKIGSRMTGAAEREAS
jgi:integrase